MRAGCGDRLRVQGNATPGGFAASERGSDGAAGHRVTRCADRMAMWRLAGGHTGLQLTPRRPSPPGAARCPGPCSRHITDTRPHARSEALVNLPLRGGVLLLVA